MTAPTSWPAPSPVSDDRDPVRDGPRAWRVRRAIVAVLAAGAVGAVVGAGRPVASIGVVIVAVAVAMATRRAGLLPRRSTTMLVLAVVAFVPWLAVRASPWLLVPDIVAACVLVGLALSMRNGAGPIDSVAGYLRRLGRVVAGAAETPAHVHLGLRTSLPEHGRDLVRRAGRPLAAGVVAAMVVASVLASGDAVFASYLDLGELPSSVGARFAGALVAMALTSAAVGAAIASERRPPIPARRHVSASSATIAIAPMCVVYVAFVAVQLSAVALGSEYVTSRTGLTYAEYARSGFFQLVAVAVATFVALVMLRPTVRTAARRDRFRLMVAAGIASACTIGMAVAAIVKLQLYADVFGLTMLRLYTTVFSAWLVVAIAFAFVALVRSTGEWIVPAVASTALIGVLAMNIVNPEAVVARHNLTATIDSAEFDIGYLTSLSDDAVPIVVEHLHELDPVDRELATRRLCDGRTRVSAALDWNHARAAARRATATGC